LPRRARTRMTSAMSPLAKLLAIVALLLTSFGMAAATATAAPHHGDGRAMAMPMEHCPDSDGAADTRGGVPECAMACSAALPAADFSQAQPLTVVCAPAERPLARSLLGIHPETATPPPRGS
jgi:hypothetical protein